MQWKKEMEAGTSYSSDYIHEESSSEEENSDSDDGEMLSGEIVNDDGESEMILIPQPQAVVSYRLA